MPRGHNVNRPKDIGTRFESAVVKWLRLNGWPYAERRALAGSYDLGDITGTPGVVWECKAGAAAHTASDGLIDTWMRQTATERDNAKAGIGVLVVARKRVGDRPERVGQHWAVVRADDLFAHSVGGAPVRMHLSTVARLLRASGYGDPLPASVVDDVTGMPLETAADGTLRLSDALIGPRVRHVA